MKQTFLILGVRSRTAWLSCMFTTGNVFCWHDLAGDAQDRAKTMISTPAQVVGIANGDTLKHLPELRDLVGNPPMLFVRRPVIELTESLRVTANLPTEYLREGMEKFDAAMDASEKLPGAITVRHDELDNEDTMRWIWAHLTSGMEFPEHHWKKMRPLHIQVKEERMRRAAHPPFWRKHPLTSEECRLLDALNAAHRASVFRNNISSITAINTVRGSGSYLNGIAGAILTVGAMHAPLPEIMRFLSMEFPGTLPDIVPGWGNAFVKGEPDAIWSDVDKELARTCPEIHKRIERTTDRLRASGKEIFPNPGCYTAAVALAIGLPEFFAPYLFIAGRLDGWTELIHTELNK